MLPRIQKIIFLFSIRYRWVLLSLLFVLMLGGTWYAWTVKGSTSAPHYQTAEEGDAYVRFDMEVYDSILANFWMKQEDLKLPELFRLSVEKAVASPQTLASPDRAGVAKMLATAFKVATSTADGKKNIALQTAGIVLYNLPPAGRNGLLSKQAETELRQNVSNIDTTKNLYQNLGLEKGAEISAIESAYKKNVALLQATTSPSGKAELEKVTYAHTVLANKNTKALYDEAGIEPTIQSRIVGTTLYLHIEKIAPTTLREFALTVDAASTTPRLESMVIDLRGNVGGALDFLPAFFGLFAGQNQYTFDLFHQGEYKPERSTQGKFEQLSRYKELAILTDAMTQSTAEVTTATFKRFHLARVVGTATRGWGTVENTYPIKTEIDPSASYTLLLVNSITLRDDNQPVEGRGVDPDVDVSKAGWEKLLPTYFKSGSLISAVRQTVSKPVAQ